MSEIHSTSENSGVVMLCIPA